MSSLSDLFNAEQMRGDGDVDLDGLLLAFVTYREEVGETRAVAGIVGQLIETEQWTRYLVAVALGEALARLAPTKDPE